MKLTTLEVAIILCIVICGAVIEYAGESVLSRSESTPDVFPPQISQIDSTIMLKINPGMMDPALNPVFVTITHLGSAVAVVSLGIALYIAGYRREGVLILVVAAIGSIIVAPLKTIVHRPRPYLTLQEVIPLEKATGMSFPSGHSEKAFALASVLSNDNKTKKLVLYAYATSIAFSRVYIGVHYPIDVVAGSILGWIVGKITLKIESIFLRFAN
ncbi:Membrane-associated phospholipid phosphatase [Archaeoglobus sulfaticallidus PM70-1]|uniref:Membrane-associated phospholipid phosphatase n=1 Tax=Archaeoglobus sulfaticallidus PM70-1 TaxID=387631 RepID=N0BJL3_9EURY|nr:phosphatase PAP2 family protein [Archaeoglobus sulfaticallidus]AGK60676.1 Membrane-associated phospholipid phosphatase [Archaeoglobus sulfaticallidus PM70-1]